jgi:urease accessory protein
MGADASLQFLRLLQLASATLPVGAYSYSEGLEFLVETQQIKNAPALQDWLIQELRYGTLRMEAAMMARAHQATLLRADDTLLYWNDWWSAARDTEELRLQSWQMGRSLLRLLLALDDPQAAAIDKTWPVLQKLYGQECNFAIAFGVGAALWQIPLPAALLGYLQSWATNLVSAGIKLIPLGQTAGQQILLNVQSDVDAACVAITQLEDAELESCGWGVSIASMGHETLYSRLFRS